MKQSDYLKSVAIYLRGEKLDPAYISDVIGVQPSRFQKKGEFKPGSNKFVAKIGMWSIKAKSKSRPVSTLIDTLFKKIGSPKIKLDQIKGVEDAHIDLFFPSDSQMTEQAIEFMLDKKQIERASKLGLSVCVTIMRS
jgi:hypothetical protein